MTEILTVDKKTPAINLTEELALIFALEQKIREMPDQIDKEDYTKHEFCNGLYARTLFLPAFTMATSAIHREECFFILRSGTMLFTTPDGPRQIFPGEMIKTPAGTKRAAFAYTDCVMTTFHPNPNELRDTQTIWENYTVEPPETLLEYLENLKVGRIE